MRKGTIVAVCTRASGGVPKYRQSGPVLVMPHGLSGDYHNRAVRPSFSVPGTIKKNREHISIVAQEVLDMLNRDPRLATMKHLQPGDLGENLTVAGLGDLSDVRDGALVRIGIDLRLRVVEHMEPCRNLSTIHAALPKCIRTKEWNGRGIYCEIVRGAHTYVTAGDPIDIES